MTRHTDTGRRDHLGHTPCSDAVRSGEAALSLP
ncbi:hypothetical protein PROPJV5_1410 [Propionibacterium ruminifibrarum]|uniref:Uncharacterized protein n=1 Tax=Propionibacterium ruminifibrarum TaxID=1962131 RepID=A0A375I4X2_9ACTN|nr:hypothetical protein PROPJV5_1410 [Propionibacterium ruminifibrarum]